MSRGARAQGARHERSLPRCLRGPLVAASFAGALLLMASPAAFAAPVSTSPPAISGTLEPGQALIASTGTWTDTSPVARYEYQWQHCVPSIEEGYECTNIDYANASTYTLPWDLAGVQARVVVIATDEQGEVGTASSEVTDVITYDGPRYTLSESSVGAGSVTGFETGPEAAGKTADANLSCPSVCGASYPYVPGTEVELIATPAPGSAFLGWGGGACSGSAPTCSLTLSASDEVTATFSGQTISPVLPPLGYEKEAGGAEPPSAGAPALGAWEPPAPSAASLAARLTSIHYRRRHLQAEVECEEARPCRLSLVLFAGSRGAQAMIARRSFTIAARRSARISLALDREGKLILARRRRLPVTTRLMLRGVGRSVLVEQGRFTLTE